MLDLADTTKLVVKISMDVAGIVVDIYVELARVMAETAMAMAGPAVMSSMVIASPVVEPYKGLGARAIRILQESWDSVGHDFHRLIKFPFAMVDVITDKVKSIGHGIVNLMVWTPVNWLWRAVMWVLSMFGIPDIILEAAARIFGAASNGSIVDFIIRILLRIIEAFIPILTWLLKLIMETWDADRERQKTLTFIWGRLVNLKGFLLDLLNPMNVVEAFPGGTVDGINGPVDGVAAADNPYNELDLGKEENRRAIVYQAQRVALTPVALLQTASTSSGGLGSPQITFSLASDFDQDGNPPPPTYVSEMENSPPGERWLFINGIANEQVWFWRSCDKIHDAFRREVKGVYNRSDGIIWDLIECAGERTAAGLGTDNALIQRRESRKAAQRSTRAQRLDTDNALIERTESSKAAQESLHKELRDALWLPGRAPPDKGCLLLRLVLQSLVEDSQPGFVERREDLRTKLRVFTFGNPSVDWLVKRTDQSLGDVVHTTEHFAHREDLVATLGVVRREGEAEQGYARNSVFYSNAGRGHLFGAHYPLSPEAYENGRDSRLLRALGGAAIE
ncbi:uncharacterized protein UV8b_05253 [Ustilaginoidea virens]|uniref:Uncharacterized protein n=1 Tax=Ustilaginoidea virens TaxID=1159556 RepID=A0A8E5HT37_USTVR|nr:uncharacterized protein UV8b_05253 [Ustilaginoidea virens]QUC21012.1 hypothetical protein UV8b_05253 [Ustilaginoidea virens]